METRSGWMSQTCKWSSAILAAVPLLPDPRPKILAWNWIMVLCLLWSYPADCHPLWDRPCSGHSQTLMRSLVPSKNPCLELMIAQSPTLVIWGWLAGAPLSSLTFSTQFCGMWQNFRTLCFSFSTSTIEVRKFMPGNSWLRSESRNIKSRHGELLKEQEFHGNKNSLVH